MQPRSPPPIHTRCIPYICRRTRGEQVCKKLVLAGASAGTENALGQTPLALARGHPETVDYLSSVGAASAYASPPGAEAETGIRPESAQEFV